MTATSDTPQNFSTGYKVWLILLFFSAAFWIGAGLIRIIIANEFFITGTLIFDPDLTESQQYVLFRLFAASSAVVLSAYLVLVVSATVAAFRYPGKWKDNGWLIMASVLFFIFVPIEIFTFYLDIDFLLVWLNAMGSFNEDDIARFTQYIPELQTLVSHRINALSGAPVIAALCYYTAAVVAIWQPMKRRPAAPESQSDAEPNEIETQPEINETVST